jgi:hypothetical protein
MTKRKCSTCPYSLGRDNTSAACEDCVYPVLTQTCGERVHSILLMDLTPVRVVSLWMSALATVAFVTYATTDGKHTPLLDFLSSLLPSYAWAALFALHCGTRLYGLLTRKRPWLRLTNQALGASLWLLLFISSSPIPPASGLSMLFIVPVAMEGWLMSRELFKWESPDD